MFVDGAFVPELSEQEAIPGVRIYSLASEIERGNGVGAFTVAVKEASDDPVVSLNNAMAADGAVIQIAAKTIVDKPIHLVFVHSGKEATAAYTRSRVVVENGAQVTLVESHEGANGVGYQVNTALALFVGDRAVVNHVKVNREGDASLHVATLTAAVGADAVFRSFNFTLDGAVTRNQLVCHLQWQECGTDDLAARTCCASASMPTRRWCSIMRSAAAPAAKSSSRCWTTKAAACSRARSSCGPMRRRPMRA